MKTSVTKGHGNMNTPKCAVMTVAIVALMSASAVAATVSQQAGPLVAYQDTEDIEEGYGAGLKYVVMWENVAPKLACGLDIRAGWLTYDGDDNDYGMDLDVFPVELTALAGYEVFGGTRPYAGIGVGGYFFDADEDDADIDDDVGFYGVLGWDQGLTEQVSVFAEAKYLWLEPDANGEDLDLGGFGANVGVAARW